MCSFKKKTVPIEIVEMTGCEVWTRYMRRVNLALGNWQAKMELRDKSRS